MSSLLSLETMEDPATGGRGCERAHYRCHEPDGAHRARRIHSPAVRVRRRSSSPPRVDAPEVVKYLLANGAKTDLVDDAGKTPIDVAVGNRGGEGQNRSSEIVTLLKGVGATR